MRTQGVGYCSNVVVLTRYRYHRLLWFRNIGGQRMSFTTCKTRSGFAAGCLFVLVLIILADYSLKLNNNGERLTEGLQVEGRAKRFFTFKRLHNSLKCKGI